MSERRRLQPGMALEVASQEMIHMRQNTVTKERFTELPAWVFPAIESRSVYALAAALALAELENRWVYLSAGTQRRLMGRTVGRMKIGMFNGELMTSRSVCFGTDRDIGYIRP